MTREKEDRLLARALKIAEQRMSYSDEFSFESPQAATNYLLLWAVDRSEEHFGVIWLTAKHKVISHEILFRGTVDGAGVYPRVVVKNGLAVNAAAAVVFHNHPSGDSTPSSADIHLTTKLKEALLLVDIRLLDHMIVGKTINSMAEAGYL